MYTYPNQKVTGAFVIGFALVAGAYVISNFGKHTPTATNTALYAIAAEPTPRVYIEVSDQDQNGIEDWKEEFVAKTPLIIDSGSSTAAFTIPNTVTDQVGIQMLQSVLRAKGRGNVGAGTGQVVTDTANILRTTTITDVLYTSSDITVIPSSDEAIRTYANAVANILIANNVPGSENELVIIDRALRTENPAELDKLDPIIKMYKTLSEQTMRVPVPEGLEKQHLDLINVYQAVYATIDGMKLAYKDPVVALLRVQRYKDDTAGLKNALKNMYNALLPHVALFNENDPAVVFIVFRK